MAKGIKVTSPFDPQTVERLRTGDWVLISGILYTARDAAHFRFAQALERGQALPLDMAGQTLYYVGPTPARPGQVFGSAGPTTSGRMDPYTPPLLELGLKAIIGKGPRSAEVRLALVKHKALYLAAVGGAGALLARAIRKAEVVAYEDLGPEAVFRLEVEDLPAIVVNDIQGGDLYQEGRARYARARPGT